MACRLTAEKAQSTVRQVVVKFVGGRVRRESHVGEERKTWLRRGVEAERIGLWRIIGTRIVCGARPVPRGRRLIRHARWQPADTHISSIFYLGMVSTDGTSQSIGGLTAQIGWFGRRVGSHPALSVHSSNELGKLSQ